MERMMSDNEFEEMYQKGDMVWVDPDGREWVPAHIHAALKDEIRRHEEVFQFSANRIAALKMEKDALREAYSLLRSFQISTVFDAKGTYAKQKSDEWYTITHQADALLTAEEQE